MATKKRKASKKCMCDSSKLIFLGMATFVMIVIGFLIFEFVGI